MHWGALLERTWPRQRSTPAVLFRRADRCCSQGRYDEAAVFVAQGLRQAPDSSVGHLISAYLHVAGRRMDRAKGEFERVLAIDPFHPRALLGLARISIEDQDLATAKTFLDRALQYYSDFPEAQALREMLADWPRMKADGSEAPARALLGAPSQPAREYDVVAMRTDGRLVLLGMDEDRGRQLAQHLMQVYRTASATLSRADLGSLRSAAIDVGSCMVFLLKDADLLFSATLDGPVEVGAGSAHIGRLRNALGIRS
ncbi:MAG TPA: tetratricopeptide repeat protein [Candidatus Methylomirabilis sp.]|nr:tetratricopeptide repeat protein [Candidatus Methylomirabilis sp.]